jgi:hypothetical protein
VNELLNLIGMARWPIRLQETAYKGELHGNSRVITIAIRERSKYSRGGSETLLKGSGGVSGHLLDRGRSVHSDIFVPTYHRKAT